jgi:hypothetical protein
MPVSRSVMVLWASLFAVAGVTGEAVADGQNAKGSMRLVLGGGIYMPAMNEVAKQTDMQLDSSFAG